MRGIVLGLLGLALLAAPALAVQRTVLIEEFVGTG